MSCTRGIRCLLFSWSELLACQREVKISLLQVEKPLLIITADSARFRHESFSPIKPPAPGRGLCVRIRRQHLICGWILHCSETFCPTLSFSSRKQVFLGEAHFPMLGFAHYFHCQLRLLPWKSQRPVVSLQPYQFLVVRFQWPALCCSSLPSPGRVPLVAYISQNISSILLQPTAFVCSLNFLRCQTSRNSTFQTVGLPLSGSKVVLHPAPGGSVVTVMNCRLPRGCYHLPYFCKSGWIKARSFYLAWRTEDLGMPWLGIFKCLKSPCIEKQLYFLYVASEYRAKIH